MSRQHQTCSHPNTQMLTDVQDVFSVLFPSTGTSTLCTSIQCQKAYAKAMQNLATIKCSFKYITIDSLNILYKTQIRPHIGL